MKELVRPHVTDILETVLYGPEAWNPPFVANL